MLNCAIRFAYKVIDQHDFEVITAPMNVSVLGTVEPVKKNIPTSDVKFKLR